MIKTISSNKIYSHITHDGLNKTEIYEINYCEIDPIKLNETLEDSFDFAFELSAYKDKDNISGTIKIYDLLDPIIFINYKSGKYSIDFNCLKTIKIEEFSKLYKHWCMNLERSEILDKHLGDISAICKLPNAPNRLKLLEIIKDYEKAYDEMIIKDIIE